MMFVRPAKNDHHVNLEYFLANYYREKDAIRKDDFIDKFPDNFVSYKLYANQLNDPYSDTVFEINKKPVSKLILLFQVTGFPGTKIGTEALYIKFTDDTREVISCTKSNFDKLKALFIDNGAIIGDMYERRSKGMPPWDVCTTEDIYNVAKKNVEQYYVGLHQEITRIVISILQAQPKQSIAIVDGGCGDKGSLLFQLENEIKMNYRESHVKLMGFDFNKNNIKKCNTVANSLKSDCDFVTGDLINTNQVINEWRKTKNAFHRASIILTLSGSLTRLVLNDGFQGLQALKSIAMNHHVDYIVGGGVGEPFLDNFIMKHIGYKSSTIKSKLINFFYYIKMSETEVTSFRKKKLDKYRILNLALSPDPVKLFNSLMKYLPLHFSVRPVIIDLSFTDLSDDLIAKLGYYLSQNNNVNLVFWHNDFNLIIKFVKTFIETKDPILAKVKITSLKHIDDDGYLMSSRLFYSALHSQLFLASHTPFEFDKTAKNKKIQLQMIKILDLKISNHPLAGILFLNYLFTVIHHRSMDNIITKSLKNETEFVAAELVNDIHYDFSNYVLKCFAGSSLAVNTSEIVSSLMMVSENDIDQQTVVINNIVNSYIELLHEMIFIHQQSKYLLHLMYIYQNGINVLCCDHDTNVSILCGDSIIKEIELYAHLAATADYAPSFDRELMKMIAQHRVTESRDFIEDDVLRMAQYKVEEMFFCATHSSVSRPCTMI